MFKSKIGLTVLMASLFALGLVSANAAEQRKASPLGTEIMLGNKSKEIAGRDFDRRAITFINTSTKRTIFVVPSNQSAAVGRGVPILPMSQQTFPLFPGPTVGGAWSAIADGEGASLEVLEFF
ncbi:hypothetical protein [Bradyrhizobium zhanjiangense]|uniref:Uncharacterized protein n=1 Tax=Bradyrhizobium zhanjiangense TaxID=1325107 RepID=A0A4Q0S9G8_9BRAD|nr:hypothetical protein [Bradyrhizobium zhanjiangense]RXH32005.1 hypothetical protein XH94_32605 [Bradyrhizobium zhanjiangense]